MKEARLQKRHAEKMQLHRTPTEVLKKEMIKSQMGSGVVEKSFNCRAWIFGACSEGYQDFLLFVHTKDILVGTAWREES